jgi:hypothetical protein
MQGTKLTKMKKHDIDILVPEKEELLVMSEHLENTD